MHPLGILHGAIVDAVTEPAAKDVALTELVIAGAALTAGAVQAGRRYLSAALYVCGLLIAFATLAIQISDNGWLTGGDGSTHSWFIAHRTHSADIAALVITDLGSPVAAVTLAVLIGARVSWRAQTALPVVVMVATTGAAWAVSTTMKLLVGRARPPIQTQQVLETNYSFPSGHVTSTSAVVGITVAVLAIGRSRRVRALLAAAAALLITLVATTRLYLGVHWLTDIVAGAILGTTCAIIGATVLYALDQRRISLSAADAAFSDADSPNESLAQRAS
ncbi:phosphatase PAP2 family protein [Nocardia sp. KC 131]|uniref:phosphatase PAP2 family protein n=1 Tax=Nocardia arseniciresistens TaxID=3392119 RepID=UPI00398F7D6A